MKKKILVLILCMVCLLTSVVQAIPITDCPNHSDGHHWALAGYDLVYVGYDPETGLSYKLKPYYECSCGATKH